MKKFITSLIIVVVLCGYAWGTLDEISNDESNESPVAVLADEGEETVWITRTGQRYHNENCRTLRSDSSQVAISEAQSRGLTPCGVCRPQADGTLATVEPASGDILPNSIHFARVARVVDGDTINVEFQDGARPERVRLIGVDTPETVHPQRGVEFYGREASDFTKISLENSHVWLQFDVGVRDRFGRLLGYIWTEEPINADDEQEIRDKMFNARLLLEGYAQVMTIQPNSRYSELFVEFQREARGENKGLWSIKPIDAGEEHADEILEYEVEE